MGWIRLERKTMGSIKKGNTTSWIASGWWKWKRWVLPIPQSKKTKKTRTGDYYQMPVVGRWNLY